MAAVTVRLPEAVGTAVQAMATDEVGIGTVATLPRDTTQGAITSPAPAATTIGVGRKGAALPPSRRPPDGAGVAVVLLLPQRDGAVRPVPQVAALTVRDGRRLGIAIRVTTTPGVPPSAGATAPPVVVPSSGVRLARPSRTSRERAPLAGPGVARRSTAPERPEGPTTTTTPTEAATATTTRTAIPALPTGVSETLVGTAVSAAVAVGPARLTGATVLKGAPATAGTVPVRDATAASTVVLTAIPAVGLVTTVAVGAPPVLVGTA